MTKGRPVSSSSLSFLSELLAIFQSSDIRHIRFFRSFIREPCRTGGFSLSICVDVSRQGVVRDAGFRSFRFTGNSFNIHISLMPGRHHDLCPRFFPDADSFMNPGDCFAPKKWHRRPCLFHQTKSQRPQFYSEGTITIGKTFKK